MNNNDQPIDEPVAAEDALEQELVAYLDGELDAAARSRVEQRLADDETYRQRMQRLDRAWQLLDALPPREADPSFAQTTVEMVTVAAREEVKHTGRTAARRRWLAWAAGAGAILLAGLMGYRVVDRLTSRQNDALVRDLPVIENIELYRHVDNIEFLRQLDEEGLFAEEVDDAI